MNTKTHTKQAKISKIEITSDKISGRGGLFFFLRYIENTGFFQLFAKQFHFLKGTEKGLSIFQFTKQLFAHFIDGTDIATTGFDRRKNDEAFASLLENTACWSFSSGVLILKNRRLLFFLATQLYLTMMMP